MVLDRVKFGTETTSNWPQPDALTSPPCNDQGDINVPFLSVQNRSNKTSKTPDLSSSAPPNPDENFRLVPLLPEGVGVLVQGTPDELGLLPEVGREEAVGAGHGAEGGLEGVLERLGRAGGRGVGVLDTGELEEALDGGGGDEASTAGGGDELRAGVSYKSPIGACITRDQEDVRGR